ASRNGLHASPLGRPRRQSPSVLPWLELSRSPFVRTDYLRSGEFSSRTCPFLSVSESAWHVEVQTRSGDPTSGLRSTWRKPLHSSRTKVSYDFRTTVCCVDTSRPLLFIR